MEEQSKVFVVSNRLPFSLKRDQETDSWSITKSSGGLVTALNGLKHCVNFKWIGSLELEASDDELLEIRRDLNDLHDAIPVFLEKAITEKYYNGFANSILWPLFHYLPGEIKFDEDNWQAYVLANKTFMDVINNLGLQEDDTVWIHDYHLMLLPKLLRDKFGAKLKIGFFLHTPFPSSEVFKVLPVRKEILEGVLASDLVGFHSYDYLRHFSNACVKLLPTSVRPEGLLYSGRLVKLESSPIGIDPSPFMLAAEQRNETVNQRLDHLTKTLQGKKVILGIDRLDYIKGLPQKIHAFQRFLAAYPEYQGKAVLIQVAVPSRTDVPEYARLRDAVYEMVGECNGKFGTSEYSPIQLIYKSIDFAELSALYQFADICLIASLRDGMNLVSYEYVASQCIRKKGVLLLSEFAGAAQSFEGAVLMNPWSLDDICHKIKYCLDLTDEEKEANMSRLLKYVTQNTASEWGVRFLGRLREENGVDAHGSGGDHVQYYDNGAFYLIATTEPQDLDGILRKLYITNAKGVCAKQFPCLNTSTETLGISENSKIALQMEPEDQTWKEEIRKLFEFFAERTIGSNISEDNNSISWNFVFGDLELWQVQAEELRQSLLGVASTAVKFTFGPDFVKAYDEKRLLDRLKAAIKELFYKEKIILVKSKKDGADTVSTELLRTIDKEMLVIEDV